MVKLRHITAAAVAGALAGCSLEVPDGRGFTSIGATPPDAATQTSPRSEVTECRDAIARFRRGFHVEPKSRVIELGKAMELACEPQPASP